MKIERAKGTRDFYPKDKAIQNYIFNTWRTIALKFGYQEVDGPLLEPIELFTKKSGQEIVEQMYTLKDKSDRKLALIPEFTPTIARMVAQNKALSKPIRWFSISRCFRYERQQLGRIREFFQFNLDLLGPKTMQADVEIIVTAVEIMKAFNCTKKDFFIRINNRKVMQSILQNNLKIKNENIKKIYNLIDKKCKISEFEFKKALKDLKLTDQQIKELNKLLKITNIKKLEKYKPKGLEELKQLFTYFKNYKISEYCRLDLTIVRGLDYYTSTVFEVFDKSQEFRAIAGGGRYDNLVDIFGGQKCPGIGYGMGDIVLELFLRKRKKLPKIEKQIDYFIATVNVEKEAIDLATKLRKKYNIELNLTPKSLSKQLNYASSIGAKKVIIMGEKDLKNNEVTIRNMVSGKEKKVKIKDIIKEFK